MNFDNLLENFALYFEGVGLSKTYGRIFGLYMTSATPLSMAQIEERLGISKSIASTELRKFLSMGVLEKVSVSDESADFYQIKKNIWIVNLHQRLEDIKKLRSIVKEISFEELQSLEQLKEMDLYCSFLEEEIQQLIHKYIKLKKSTR